jgi:hypothetical protein
MTPRVKETGWLRQGYPVLPSLLRIAWQDEPIPAGVLRAAGLYPPVTLGALDARIWDRLEGESNVLVLANYVGSLARSRIYFGHDASICDQPIFGRAPMEPFSLEVLPFRQRTHTVLRAAGVYVDHGWLAQVTPRQFIALKHAGVVTLLDFAVVLEAHWPIANERFVLPAGPVGDEPSPHDQRPAPGALAELVSIASEIRGLPSAEGSSAKDPRLPPRVRRRTFPASTIGEAIDDIVARGHAGTASEAAEALSIARDVRAVIVRLRDQQLEDALLEMVAAVVQPKHVSVLARRLGWDGRGGSTLEQAAALAGVSRERVRQIEAAALKKIAGHLYCPSLDASVARLEKAASTLAVDGPTTLLDAGLVRSEFLPAGVVSAAQVLDRTVRFSIGRDGRIVLGLGEKEGEALRAAASSLLDTCYISSVSELQARAQELETREVSAAAVRAFLGRLESLVWLDDDRTWFWLNSHAPPSSVVTATRKVLAVSSRITLESLRSGVLRATRARGAAVPRRAFEGVCRALGCGVDGAWVTAPPDLETASGALSKTENVLVAALRANENVLDYSSLRDECIRLGMNRNTFCVYSSYAPFLERLAPGVYALRGASVDPTRVAFLRKTALPRETSLQDHGWTEDGAIWVGYRVTAGLLNGGVLGLPQPIARLCGDRQYPLLTSGGVRVGALTVRHSTAWGLSSFFRRRGVEVDDCLVVLLDTAKNVAIARVGSEELLFSYRDGEGEGPNQLLAASEEVELNEDAVTG